MADTITTELDPSPVSRDLERHHPEDYRPGEAPS
jgi:hypothetical protein